MARAEQLEFGWKFGDSLTPGGFQRVLDEKVYRVAFEDLSGHGYTILAASNKGERPQYTILIKESDSIDEQKTTLVHGVLHIHRGFELVSKLHGIKTERYKDPQEQVDEEEQVESETGRFVKQYSEIVGDVLNKYKNGL